MSKLKIRWKPFPVNKPDKEDYYFVTRNTYGRLSTSTLYWNADDEVWVNFTKCLYPGIPVDDVVAFAKLPEPYRTGDDKKLTIKIKYLTDIDKIEKIPIGDLIDLRCAQDIWFEKDEFKLIPLGVAMQLPEGYRAQICPRSSTFKNYYIIQANSVGQIDESYCGDNDEWKFPAIALKETFIPKNARICQFEIVKKQPELEIEEVETLDNPDRDGFGSTGK